MAKPDTSSLLTHLGPAHQVTFLLPQHPSHDVVASALALKLACEASGKTITTVCPDPMTVEFNRLIAIDSIITSLNSRNLVITFPGQTEQVDKISYNLEKGELQLVVTPKSDAPPLDHNRLKFIPGTHQTDLFILIGVNQLSDLGPLSKDSSSLFTPPKTFSLAHHPPQENFTPNQLYDPDASSLSELTASIIESLGFSLLPDVSTNLLSGIEVSTQNFSSPTVTYATFETAALLLRRGARRHQPISASSFPPGAIPVSADLGYGSDSAPPTNDNPPPDWYEPKIYHGPILQ